MEKKMVVKNRFTKDKVEVVEVVEGDKGSKKSATVTVHEGFSVFGNDKAPEEKNK